MRAFLLPFILLAATLLSAGCVDDDPNGNDAPDGKAVIATSLGDIHIAFFCDAAPLTVENFQLYAQDGFYEGTIVHRIMQDFMIQGGGFTTDWDQKQTRGAVPLEYEVPNERGTVAMARTQDPNSATSQFFINTDDNSGTLGPGGVDAYGYTVFAKVIGGMDVVDALAAVEVKPHRHNPREQSEPVDPPVIQSVSVGEACPDPDADVEPTYGVELGLIHNTLEDGVWSTRISATPDHIPYYVVNTGNQDDNFMVDIDVPEGWNVSSEPERFELTKNTAGKGSNYPYAAAGSLTVAYDGDLALADDAELTLTLRSEGSDVTESLVVRLLVAPGDGNVSAIGDEVELEYAGSFESGEEFDSGSFGTQVGSPQTVRGFSNGLMGLEVGETVDIRFPPELGYGYAQTGAREQFNGEWLNFEIKLTDIN